MKFLDVLVTNNITSLDYQWHLKDTNTGLYIPNSAYAPVRYKTSAIRALIFRAKRFSSSQRTYENCFSVIKDMFIANGYSNERIDEIKKEVDNFQKKSKDTKNIYWRLPYIKNLENQTRKTVSSLNKLLPVHNKIIVAYKTLKTSNLFPNKDRLKFTLSSDVVYEFSCQLCSSSYIGETKRHLYTRIKEHMWGIPSETEISKHVHQANFEDFSIIYKTRYTKIAESIALNHNSRARTLLNEHDSSYKLRVFV